MEITLVVLAAQHEDYIFVFVNGSDHGEKEAKPGKSFQMCGRSIRYAVKSPWYI